ncbi:MAG: DNA polymerase III [Treponema sp.]|nr:DNA polymerase III [Treponema sp.]
MFENLVNQSASKALTYDINNNFLPRAILFSGPETSGKLTAAFELSRVLNCKEENYKKSFNCMCSSCLQQKALTTTNLMLLGPRDCFLEISLAKECFLKAVKNNESYQVAARYLFLRSVRKLTLRFNGILWEGDSKINKIGALIESINENLEIIDFPRQLPDFEKLQDICQHIQDYSADLEKSYLYDSIPINQIRNLEAWCHVKTEEGRKVIIIENADRMQASVRNALLKILEEPPESCLFILLTSKRNAIMQTILSRVRTYNFKPRSLQEEKEVLERVFHDNNYSASIYDYLLTFLPVSPDSIKEEANKFYKAIANRQIPETAVIVKNCNDFTPRVELRLFLRYLMEAEKPLRNSPAGCEFAAKSVNLFKNCWENITLYNQNPNSALEILLRDMSALNKKMQGVMK